MQKATVILVVAETQKHISFRRGCTKPDM